MSARDVISRHPLPLNHMFSRRSDMRVSRKRIQVPQVVRVIDRVMNETEHLSYTEMSPRGRESINWIGNVGGLPHMLPRLLGALQALPFHFQSLRP